jgi:hypothetical protein
MGERRNELSLLQIFAAYQRRYDLEHFFRFGKQRLLLHRYQTPETEHEEKWWLMAHLAYLQLWVARTLAQAVHRPWETIPAQDSKRPLSATQIQRDFERIIRQTCVELVETLGHLLLLPNAGVIHPVAASEL